MESCLAQRFDCFFLNLGALIPIFAGDIALPILRNQALQMQGNFGGISRNE